MKEKAAAMIIVLSATAIIVGGMLAGVYRLAEPRIEANRLAEERRAIFAVLPEAQTYEIIRKTIMKDKGMVNVRIFKGIDIEGKTVGYAFIAGGAGFQGKIEMMVGLHPDYLKLHGMEVLEQVETPGLGNKIAGKKFRSQFKGLEVFPKIEYVKNRSPEKPNQIQAITGATISSKAVVRIINKEAKKIIAALKRDENPHAGKSAPGE